ncbi:MAG: three-Cys-motif partner protein TcmP [Terriglobales bacterium]|jgi:three-Cys-motif partner protein
MGAPKIDEIGPWSVVKLDILKRYAVEYSKILSNQRDPSFFHLYIDAFAGTGVHLSKKTGEMVLGSPLNALLVEPPFREYHLIDLDGDKIDGLSEMIGKRADVLLHKGDCNQVLLREVFPNVQRADYRRGLCLLDPYGLTLDWRVVQEAGVMQSLDVFINFPIYDININVLRRDSSTALPLHIERMNAYWGDESWRDVAYDKSPGLFGDMEEKVSNDRFAEAFRKRLKDVAGFKRVPDPLPMKNSKGSVVYYLFFASQKGTAENIVKYIFDKFGDN